MQSFEICILQLLYLTALSDGELAPIELESIKAKLVTYPLLKTISSNRREKVLSDLLGTLKDKTTDDLLDEINQGIPSNLKETAYALALEVCAKDLDMHSSELVFMKKVAKIFNLDKEMVNALRKSVDVRYFADK
tara:strand:- start:4 stop:408 length:405 start_codon:yes stop_codon:yes gene_type:complete